MAPPPVTTRTTTGTTATAFSAPKAAAKPAPVKAAPKPAVKAGPYANPQKYIAQAVARLGVPLTDPQIQSQAQGQLSPLVQALTESIGRQAQAGTSAIGGYTSELAKSLAPYQANAANIYGGAQQAQAASDAALSAKLSGGGAQDAQALGARLASINAPAATGQAVGQATADATGAGNALYATGSASLANLIAAGAAEQSYAGKLPGLAGLAGLQQTGQLQGRLASSLADQTGQLEAKVPDIVSGLQGQRSDLLNRRESLRTDLAGFFDTRAYKQQALDQEAKALGQKTSAQKAADAAKSKALQERIRHDKAGEAAAQRKLDQAAAKAKRDGTPKPSASLSRVYGYIVDANGHPILGANGKRIPVAKTTKKTSSNPFDTTPTTPGG